LKNKCLNIYFKSQTCSFKIAHLSLPTLYKHTNHSDILIIKPKYTVEFHAFFLLPGENSHGAAIVRKKFVDDMKKACDVAITKSKAAVLAAMRNVHFVAKNELANTMYPLLNTHDIQQVLLQCVLFLLCVTSHRWYYIINYKMVLYSIFSGCCSTEGPESGFTYYV